MKKILQSPFVLPLACCLVLVAAVFGTRGELFSIAAHLVRQAASPQLTAIAVASPNPQRAKTDFVIRRPDSDKAITLLAVGDIADCAATTVFGKTVDDLLYSAGLGTDMTARTVGYLDTEKLVRQFPDAPLLVLGDLVYASGSPAEFNHCYQQSWGRHKARTFPTPGNHEYNSPGALGYYNYWGDRAGPDRRGFYSIRLGNWLILSLNSEAGVHDGSAQFDWIARTLDQADTDCVLAFYHSPAFSTDHRNNSDGVKPLFKLLEGHGVTAVLNGHNHFYERTRPLDGTGGIARVDGMLTFVVGTGGKVRKFKSPRSAISDRIITLENGILRLGLRDGEFDWQFIATSGGRVLDQGAAACRDRHRLGNW